MTIVHRVLPPEPILSMEDYVKRRGGRGIEVAREVEPEAIIDEIEASGLRGRGGAGFPTHIKWRTVRQYASDLEGTTVVVNGAEGEPGTFKDRTILAYDPYEVIEGALIAALAVGADRVVLAVKESFGEVVVGLKRAVAEAIEAGWAEGIDLVVFEGPREYLYGEETALLEVIDGRYPFPRLAPPYRRGVDEVVEHRSDLGSGSGLSADVEMAGPDAEEVAPPTLVENVESVANVAHIIARGGSWFRTEGTEQSAGTFVATVTGSVQRAGVAEFMMGTTLREVIDTISGGVLPDRELVAVMSGVSNGLITADQLDTPVSYEGFNAIGTGMGSAGFIVFDDQDDLVGVAAGVARFLSIESCGQCTPCKQGGLALSGRLAQLARSQSSDRDLTFIEERVDTVADGARCFLASQQEIVVGSILKLFPEVVRAHVSGSAPAVEPALITELVDIRAGQAVLDPSHLTKQPDWSFDDSWSGQVPAERYDDHRSPQHLAE